MIATNLNPWIVCPKPIAQARLRLFCFPYAGGGASVFRDWSNYFPASIEVCAVQLPGREGRWREPLFTHWQPLVQALAHALHPYLDRPFAFFGHSLGALISFELARALARQNNFAPFIYSSRAMLLLKFPTPSRRFINCLSRNSSRNWGHSAALRRRCYKTLN